MLRYIWLASATLMLSSMSTAAMCPFEQAGSSLTREGLVLVRYAIGLRDTALVQGTDFSELDGPTIEATIGCASCALDITGDGNFDTADATIIARRLAGLSGASLTNGLDLGSGSRSSPAAVQSFLTSGCGVNTAKHYVHTVVTSGVGANLCGTAITRLDHVLANNNPNAIIIVTSNVGSDPNLAFTVKGSPFVFYSTTNANGSACVGRWAIAYASATSYNMSDGLKFNISIVGAAD